MSNRPEDDRISQDDTVLGDLFARAEEEVVPAHPDYDPGEGLDRFLNQIGDRQQSVSRSRPASEPVADASFKRTMRAESGLGQGGRTGQMVDEERDEVDDLVAAWQQQKPDLDVAPLHVLSRVSRLARHLDLARRGAFAAHGLEPWEFDVLSALRQAGPPFQLTPGALLRATLVTSGTMTNRIDRLATAGLVSREPDPRDRRGVLVALSDIGREVVDAAFADLLEREHALLAGLDSEQRGQLAELLRTLLIPFDEGGNRVRTDPLDELPTVGQRRPMA